MNTFQLSSQRMFLKIRLLQAIGRVYKAQGVGCLGALQKDELFLRQDAKKGQFLVAKLDHDSL